MARAIRALVINPCGKNLVRNLKCGPRARLVRGITSNDRVHITARLFSNILKVTSKCGKNEKVAHQASPSVSLMSSPYFDIICHGLLTHGNMESIWCDKKAKCCQCWRHLCVTPQIGHMELRTNQNAHILQLYSLCSPYFNIATTNVLLQNVRQLVSLCHRNGFSVY